MKLLFTGLLISFSFLLTAQQTSGKFDIRIGTGISSNNDLTLPYVLNNQLNYRLRPMRQATPNWGT